MEFVENIRIPDKGTFATAKKSGKLFEKEGWNVWHFGVFRLK